MKKLVFSCMLLLPVTLVCGQDLTRLWTSNLGSEFRWLSLATDGTPIVGSLMHRGDTATYMRVSGIDADTGEIKWNYEPDGDEMISGIKPISNSNFVQLNDAPLTILNVATGKPLVEIAKDGITAVYDYGFLPASGQLWIDADFGGAHNLFLYDLITGMNLWNNSELFNGASKSNQMVIKGVATMRAEDTEAPTLRCPPINQGKDNMIVVVGNEIIKLSIATGVALWRVPIPNANQGKPFKMEMKQSLHLIAGRKNFFVAVNANTMAFSYEDGKPLWKEFVNTTGPPNQIIYDEKGLIFFPALSEIKGVYGTTRLAMVNESTGLPLWLYPPSFNGVVEKYVYVGRRLAIVTENSIGEHSLNIVDVDAGKFLLSPPIQLAGAVQALETTARGILYRTERTINIVSLEGTAVTDMPVQGPLRKPIAFADAGNKIYFYSRKDDNLYEVDKVKGSGKILNQQKISFKGSESPEHLEVMSDGILLSSSQNATLITYEGITKYFLHRPASSNYLSAIVSDVKKMPGDVKIITGTEKSTATTDASQKPLPEKKSVIQFDQALFLMTTENRLPVLMMVSKASGEVVATVPCVDGDDEPTYKIDAPRNLIYYLPKRKDDYGNVRFVGEFRFFRMTPN